ncbi:MAG: ribosome small subunit-dependent GTPase A [Muribaculaceae bacterium]|nr:ribosome small subunit-dependent GTPase A [Muribaculaceae bacterium]MEE1298099.1 ribosome small subunit-dependent GTPase A [Muribaculaceae bacterium]
MKGLVIKNTGSWYVVKIDDGSIVNCKIKGNFRLKGIRTTNPVAVGDMVEVAVKDDASYIIGIEPRRNYIIRKASNLSKESQILASNIDQALLIVTLKEPVTNTTFIDRFLATAEAYNVPVVIVINKVDLLSDADDHDYLEAVKSLYEIIGYKVIKMNALAGDGLEELQQALAGKVTLLSGNSGVGKSSIINLVLPGLNLKTGNVSESHHTGMHTTTFSEMFDLPGGGSVIDTPGVKGFGTIDFDKAEVAHYFKEIFKISANCKYNNCTHTHEPGCAVRDAVENHYISESRYQSYLSILEDGSDDKYRKPF